MDFSFIVADLETDGFSPSVIHMIGVQDLMTGDYESFVGLDRVSECVFRMQEESKMIVGHSFADFDHRTIKSLAAVDLNKKKIVDTVIMSKELCNLFNNKLSTWGIILGFPKLPSPRFDKYTLEMDTYCERDVRLNSAMFGILYRMWMARKPSFDRNITEILSKYENEMKKSFVNWGAVDEEVPMLDLQPA